MKKLRPTDTRVGNIKIPPESHVIGHSNNVLDHLIFLDLSVYAGIFVHASIRATPLNIVAGYQ